MFHFKRHRNVLGMNARILQFMRPLNSVMSAKVANDKLATKNLLISHGIPTPRLYGVINKHSDVEDFDWSRLPASFVLKPNYGYGGAGIMVVFGRSKRGHWVKSDRSPVDLSDIRERTYNILDGNFSINNVPDMAFFEQRIKVQREIKPFSKGGIPDIRVLVANYVPVMAMLRLPSPDSHGRANLHMGGVGCGIDLGTGRTTTAIMRDRYITNYPDTRLPLSDIILENFREILHLAAKTANILKLGYTGIDIAVDREEGPMVLEANSRPGLSIQLANRTTLRDRLRRLEELTVRTPEHAVDVALSLYTQPNIEKKRKRIGVRENVLIFDGDGNPHNYIAKIDTGAYRSSIDRELAEEYGLLKSGLVHRKIIKSALGKEERQVIPLKFILGGEQISTEVTIAGRGHLKHELLIGRRDLGPFLIDPQIKRIARQ